MKKQTRQGTTKKNRSPRRKPELMLAQKNALRGLPKEEYAMLLEMCRYANSLANAAEWHIRHFKEHTGRHLSYEKNNQISKHNPNYKMLQANCAQQTLKRQEAKHQAYFGLLKAKKEGSYTGNVNPPGFRPKGGYDVLIVAGDFIIDRNDGYLVIPMSREFRKKHPGAEIRIRKPSNLEGIRIRQLEIHPAGDGSCIDAVFVYEGMKQNMGLDRDNALCLDTGIDNLVTGVTSDGTTFIVDGRKIKAINRHYNKQRAEIQQELRLLYGKSWSRKLTRITKNRDNKITDVMRKTAKLCVDIAAEHNCGTIIIGVNKGWKQNCSMGKAANQRFCFIPHARFRQMLKTQCEKRGIRYVEQEESYTSKCSALDGDWIPSWDPNHIVFKSCFSGKRVKRGLYRTADGRLINADVNGALNIGRKCRQNGDPQEFGNLQLCMGALNVPARLRI